MEKIEGIEGIPNIQAETMKKLLDCFASHGISFWIDSDGSPGVSMKKG